MCKIPIYHHKSNKKKPTSIQTFKNITSAEKNSRKNTKQLKKHIDGVHSKQRPTTKLS